MKLEVKGLTKIFNEDVIANDNINMTIKDGEIHGIIGENGAGKTTLMNMLYGMVEPTSGEIFLNDEKIELKSSKDAIKAGIGMVHQHFQLVESFTAAENMRLINTDKGFLINKKVDNSFVKENAKKYNLSIDIDTQVRNMSIGMKQKLELLKALTSGAKIIILDEPTAVLTPQETDELFLRFEEMKKRGLTIIFISHKLKEIKRICDRITVLRDGKSVGTAEISNITEEDMSFLMVGERISWDYEKSEMAPVKEILSVNSLSYVDEFNVPKLNNLSLEVYDNEIVGIAGVDGNGQDELVNSIMGILDVQQGEIILSNQDITDNRIDTIRKFNFGYVTSDRMTSGLEVGSMIWENMVINTIDKYTSYGLLNHSEINKKTNELISKYKIKTTGPLDITNNMSGGNMQKVVIAREFEQEKNFLILDEPSRGVDIGAISFIHHQILKKREEGFGILLISSDMSELIALSDRILVMYEGRIVANLPNKKYKVTEKELGLYMLGLKTQEMEEAQ